MTALLPRPNELEWILSDSRLDDSNHDVPLHWSRDMMRSASLELPRVLLENGSHPQSLFRRYQFEDQLLCFPLGKRLRATYCCNS